MAWGNLKRGKAFLIFSAKCNYTFAPKNTLEKEGQRLWLNHSGGLNGLLLGQTASNGAAVLFKNNFEYKIHNILKDDEGRYILIHIEMLNKRLTLANACTQQWRIS